MFAVLGLLIWFCVGVRFMCDFQRCMRCLFLFPAKDGTAPFLYPAKRDIYWVFSVLIYGVFALFCSAYVGCFVGSWRVVGLPCVVACA